MIDLSKRRAYHARYQKHRYHNDPEHRRKHLARVKAYDARTAGKIARTPCADCGNENTQAHHDDYSQPLNVVWLCRACHLARHKQDSRGCHPQRTLGDSG